MTTCHGLTPESLGVKVLISDYLLFYLSFHYNLLTRLLTSFRSLPGPGGFRGLDFTFISFTYLCHRSISLFNAAGGSVSLFHPQPPLFSPFGLGLPSSIKAVDSVSYTLVRLSTTTTPQTLLCVIFPLSLNLPTRLPSRKLSLPLRSLSPALVPAPRRVIPGVPGQGGSGSLALRPPSSDPPWSLSLPSVYRLLARGALSISLRRTPSVLPSVTQRI